MTGLSFLRNDAILLPVIALALAVALFMATIWNARLPDTCELSANA